MKAICLHLFVYLLCAVVCQPVWADEWELEPYATVVGGMKLETIQATAGENITVPNDKREDRVFTLALSRFGMRGRMAGGFTFESEFEVNAGYNGHGTGVWEGQAAIQVETQLIRFSRWGLRVDVGHVRDESSIDYFSIHMADQLLTDRYTRDSLLASGGNRGNGIYATYEILKGLKLGFTINAANPTSNTGILVVGGSYGVFDRFYFVAVKELAQDQNRFPRDNMTFTIISPSATFDSDFLQVQLGVQFFSVNTTLDTAVDDTIDGINLRGGIRGRILKDMFTPFFNFSWVKNNVIDPSNNSKSIPGRDWEGMTLGGGLDFNIVGKNGVGVQYSRVMGQEGEGSKVTQQYINFGASYWLAECTSIAARVAIYRNEHVEKDQNGDKKVRDGETAFFVTVRTAL